MSYRRTSRPRYTKIERFHKTRLINALYKFIGITFISSQYNFRQTYIGRIFHRFGSGHRSPTVRIGYGADFHSRRITENSIMPVYDIMGTDNPVVESYHHRQRFNHRTRFITLHGIIHSFYIFPSGQSRQIRHGLYITRRHLHHYGNGKLRLCLFDGLQ